MRELDRIRRALHAAASRGESVLLATVMNVDGSVYRGAGARMVVSMSGETSGGVSGGCLEADVIARAPDIVAMGKCELVRYDTRAGDDVVLGLGLGCQGVIDVLLEPLGGSRLLEATEFYARLGAHREPVTLLTLVSDHAGDALGARALVNADGQLLEGDPALLALDAGVAREQVRPAIPLVICGGGSDAIPLAALAKSMGWHVTVVDHRQGFATASRFPAADHVVCANVTDGSSSLASQVSLDHRTVAVSMAHSAAHDRAYLHALLDAGACYIGVLGPRRRTLELLGGRITNAQLPSSVFSPIGLDTGAETPDEIALSIVAEIAAVMSGRDGGHLRNRTGPIHERERPLP